MKKSIQNNGPFLSTLRFSCLLERRMEDLLDMEICGIVVQGVERRGYIIGTSP